MKFLPTNPEKSNFDCEAGELAYTSGVTAATDGTLRAAPLNETVTALPQGATPLAIIEDQLIWFAPDPSPDAAVPEGTYRVRSLGVHTDVQTDVHTDANTDTGTDTDICRGTAPVTAEVCDDMVVVATLRGIIYLAGGDDGWYRMDPQALMPAIDFALERRDCLSSADTVMADATDAATAIGTGAGASSTHPAAGADAGGWREASATVFGLWQKARETQADARGLFTSPFLVRYALRSADGVYLAVSAPRLMLPTVLPPCIGVSAVTDGDKARLSVDLSQCHTYALTYRCLGEVSPRLLATGASIDILVTPQIPTCDIPSDGVCDYGIVRYAALVAAANTGAPNRGRAASGSADVATIFDGRYAVEDGAVADHRVPASTLSMQVLGISPNTSLCHSIVTASEYHKVAEIHCANLSTGDYAPVEIECTSARAVSALPEAELPTRIDAADIDATALLHTGERMMAAMQSRRAPAPVVPAAVPAGAPAGATVTVYSRHAGVVCRRSGRLVAGTDGMVGRLLHVPDADAYLATVSDGASVWTLPLQRHVSGSGAYWFGGLDMDYLPTPAAGEDDDDVSDTYPCGGVVAPSVEGEPWLFDAGDVFATGASRIVGMHRVPGEPSVSRYGRYPVYMFTDRGIMMPQYDTSADRALRRYHSCRLLSGYRVASAELIADTPQGVAFVHDGVIGLLCGTKYSRMYVPEAGLPSLPHFEEVFGAAVVPGSAVARSLVYVDGELCIGYGDATLRMQVGSGMAGWFAGPSGRRLAGAADGVVAAGNVVLRRAGALAGVGVVVVTRPIRGGSGEMPATLTSVRIMGNVDASTTTMVVYASGDGVGWHAIASARGVSVPIDAPAPIDGPFPQPWYLVALATTMHPRQSVHGLLFIE